MKASSFFMQGFLIIVTDSVTAAPGALLGIHLRHASEHDHMWGWGGRTLSWLEGFSV